MNDSLNKEKEIGAIASTICLCQAKFIDDSFF